MVSLKEIREIAKRIARDFQPERIILFGSHARGTSTAASDVDLLVVMRVKGRRSAKAVEILEKIRPRFGVDMLVRTPEEVRQRLSWNDFFLRDIIEKGRVLYEAPDT
jgi:predicted nucleotidyltransferase